MKNRPVRRLFLAAGILMAATTTRADYQTFELTYSGAAFGNDATATATITLDLDKVVNPGFTEQDVSPFVTAFSITVSGAGLADGTFGIDDYLNGLGNFGGFYLDTYGGTLDFSRELFGQPTAGDPFGSVSGNGGDFAIVANTFRLIAPSGGNAFQIYVFDQLGGQESLYMTSFRPTAVPEPTSVLLTLSGASLIAAGARRNGRKRGEGAGRERGLARAESLGNGARSGAPTPS